MAIDMKKTLGIMTTIAVLSFTVYSIRKYYVTKKQDSNSIDFEEAKRMMSERGVDVDLMLEVSDELENEFMADIIDEARDMANYNASFDQTRRISIRVDELDDELDIDDEEEYESPDPQEIQDSKNHYEEDEDVIDDLRYEPNSIEAREQFINMELASLGRDNDTRDIISMLYDHPFNPTCDADRNLETRLMDHRIKFFGTSSKWIHTITYGDVVIYYGKATEYNCGENVRYWVEYLLNCADLNDVVSTSDERDARIDLLNVHKFYNRELQSHGLFGLNENQITEAHAIAQSQIDEHLTYDIEFNLFIQGVVNA